MKRKIVLFITLLACCLGTKGQTGTKIISTPVPTATIGSPVTTANDNCIAVDPSSKDIYVYDNTNSVIWKTTTAGTTTIFAGISGTPGHGSSTTPAAANTVSIGNVVAMVVDKNGNLFAADDFTGIVMKITPAGSIVDFAGGGSTTITAGSSVAQNSADLSGIKGLAYNGFMLHDELWVEAGCVANINANSGGNFTYQYGFSGAGTQGFAVSNNGSIYFMSLNFMGGTMDLGVMDGSGLHNIGACGPMSTVTTMEVNNAGNRVLIGGTGGTLLSKDFTTYAITGGSTINYCASGTPGYSGDCGAAASANVNNTYNITYDLFNGDIYTYESTGNRVRRIYDNTIPNITSNSFYVCQNSTSNSLNSFLTATDVETCQNYTWSISSGSSHGSTVGFPYTSTGASRVPSGLTYTPVSGYSGTDNFIITISDGVDTRSVTVNVIVNTASSYDASINMTSPWILTGDDAYTYCPGLAAPTFSATLTQHGTSTTVIPLVYTWYSSPTGLAGSWGSPISSSTSSAFVPTAPTATIYYKVVMDYGCQYEKVIKVFVPASSSTCSPCNYYTVNTARGYDGTPTVSTSTCPDCSTVQPFHTIYSTTMAPGTSSVPVNYYIATPPTGLEVRFPTGTSTISDDIFYIDGGVNLAVGSGDDITSDLTIDHCHFFGSEACPWNGIKVYIVNNGTLSGTNKLKVKNNTLIENCATAAAATPLSGWGTQFPTAAIYNFGGNVSGVVTSTSLTMSTSPLPSGYTDATPELNCMINCSNVIFNRNDCGITISNYLLDGPSGSYTPPQTFPFNITNNVFTSRRLSKFSLSASAASSTDYYPFSWPSEVNLATQTSTDPYLPAFGVDNYAVANPRTATTQNMGIHLINVNVKHPNTNKIDPYITYGVKIGNYDSTNNLFDTLYAGITITNSNAFMYNNVFKRLFNLGINTLNDSKYSTKIEGTNLTNGNRFYNVRGTSIYFGSPSYDFSAKYCTIESEIVTTASTVTGFSIANLTSYKNINIENNTIYSIPLPVNISVSDPTASTSTVGNILIKNNLMYDIFPGSTPTGSSLRYIREPISVRNNRAYSVTGTILSGAGLNIENNTLANALRGVFVGTGTSGTTGFREYPVIINNNVISLKTGATPSYGILSRKNYHTGDQIDGNSITGPGYSTASFTGVSCDGIGVSSSSRTDVSCNYVGDINTGFYFTGTNHVDWKKNVMEKNKYGLYLSGQIDNQGGNSPCDPIDNYWAWSSTSSNWWATTSGVYHTFTTINPTSSVLNVRNVLTGSTSGSQYSPFNNGNSGGTAYSTGASTIVDLSSCSGLPAAPSICAPIPTGFSAKGEVLLSESTSTQSYTLYPNPTTGSITIAQSEVVDGAVTAKVINIVGATIYEGSLNFTGGQSQLTLPDVASGIYLVELKDAAGHRFTSKVIVQR